ncbi:MAG TPA: translocation/assembly module TamB domain-containing protein, partial [Rheinheimera sp.]|nr:translocation/assembly module TamB domain-containing protein [Rheinheimera sp.]
QDEVQKITELQLSMQWQDQQLELLQLDVNHPQVTLHGSGKVFTEQHYALQANLNVQLTQGEFSNQQLQLDASGDLSRLHLQARATGAVNATLGATLDLLQAQLPHRLELHSEQLQWPLSAATPQFTLSRSTLLLQGELQHSQFSGQLSINGAAAPAAAAEFSGYSSLSGLTLEKLLVNTLGGQINLNASLDWQQGLNWQGQTKLDDIQPGLFWPDYDGKLNGTLQHRGAIAPDNSWQLAIPQMALSGTLRNYALTLNGSLNAADNSGQGDYQLHTPGLTLNHADNTISVQGSVQQDWNLSVTAAIPALAQSVSGAQGSLNGQFQITGPRLQPEIDGDISAAELRWQDFSLAQLSVSSAISLDSAQRFNSKISLEATDARYQQHKVQRISLDLDGTELKHQLDFVLNSTGHQARLQLTGGLSENRQHWQGLLQDAEISSLPGSWQLEHAADIKFELPQQRLTIAAHCWQQQDSSICLSKPLSASSKNVAASVDINQFNLTSLAALIPNQFALTGKIDATLDANWQQGKAPTATLAISSVNGQMTQQLDTPLVLAWQKLMLSSELADDTLRSTLQLNIADSSALNAELQIAQLQSGARQLQGQIKLQQFALSVLQPLLGEFSELTGLVSSDLSIAGTLDAPLLNGELALTQGRIKGKQAPADIDNADVTLLFSGQQASLTGLISTAKGEITVSGDASWQQATDWQAAVNIKGDALRLQVPQARLLIAPDLTLHATPELTRLSGTVTIPSANISIDSLPQNAIELSDDLVLLNKELQPIPQQQKSTFIFQTDIKVVLGNRVKLSAFGLKTLLNGNLRVRQQPKKPLLI